METTTNKQPAVAVADVQPLYLGASSDEKAPTKCDACFVASDAATRAPSSGSGHSPRHSTLTLALVAAGAALAGGGLSTLARELGGLGGTCADGGDQAALSPRGVGGGGLGDDGITFESTRAAEVLGELSSAEVQAVASYFVEATGISASRSLSGATQASGPVVVSRRKRPRGGGCLPALPSGPPLPFPSVRMSHTLASRCSRRGSRADVVDRGAERRRAARAAQGRRARVPRRRPWGIREELLLVVQTAQPILTRHTPSRSQVPRRRRRRARARALGARHGRGGRRGRGRRVQGRPAAPVSLLVRRTRPLPARLRSGRAGC